MIRFLMWLVVWCLFLGLASINVEYRDGLKIKLPAAWGPSKRRPEGGK